MKTSKATGKSKKASEKEQVIKNFDVLTVNSVPSEEDIRQKAQEVYRERIARGKYGTAQEDWFEAEALLRDSNE